MIDLSVATLVDQLADGFEVRFAVSNPRLDDAKHLHGWLGKLDENSIVDLEETEELKDFAGLGGDLVDTAIRHQYRLRLYKELENIPLDAHNKDNLGLGRDIKGALLLGLAGKTDLLTLGLAVLLHVLLSTLEDGGALLLVGLSIVDVSKARAPKLDSNW